MTWDRNQSTLENVAAISGDFHTHSRYEEFYDTFGPRINGFPGIYAICVAMAKTMTEWEASLIRKGHIELYGENGIDWIIAVEEYVDRVISTSLIDGYLATHSECLSAAIEKARAP